MRDERAREDLPQSQAPRNHPGETNQSAWSCRTGYKTHQISKEFWVMLGGGRKELSGGMEALFRFWIRIRSCCAHHVRPSAGSKWEGSC